MAYILVADADPATGELFQKALESQGHIVFVACDEEQVAKLLSGIIFDAIVLDLPMPCHGGLEILKELRDARSKTRVIAVSATTDEGLLRSAGYIGAHATLEKPLLAESLITTVTRVLNELG